MNGESSRNNDGTNRVGSTGGSAFDRAQWLQAPDCVKCSRPMYLKEGCEWPEDHRLLLCGDCMLTALGNALAQLDEVDEALTELGWHTDRGILQRVKQLTKKMTNEPPLVADPISMNNPMLSADGAREEHTRLGSLGLASVSAFRRDDPMRGFWESRFDELATFNGESSRGIQHTPEKRERMAAMQSEYNAKLESLPGVIVLR